MMYGLSKIIRYYKKRKVKLYVISNNKIKNINYK